MKPFGLINDEWILSYAAGSLSEAHALMVATHCHYHPELQEKIIFAEGIGGELMENMEPTPISNQRFDELLTEIDNLPIENKVPSINSSLPNPLAEYLDGSLDQIKWRLMGPGLYQKKLWKGQNGLKLWLLKARKGTKIPIHDHKGLEMTLVLKGSYHVEDRHYTTGMIEIAEPGLKNHQPKIDKVEDCICLVVTEAPIYLHSFIGRLMQPLIGL
ncbi:MAG: ChrR family anti-sigma-E factor [Sphingomonadales bacterium]